MITRRKLLGIGGLTAVAATASLFGIGKTPVAEAALPEDQEPEPQWRGCALGKGE